MSGHRLSPRIRYRRIDGEVVVVAQHTGEVLGLNDTASRVVELLGQGLSRDDIVGTLRGEYAGDDIAADVDALLHELVQAGVCEVVS